MRKKIYFGCLPIMAFPHLEDFFFASSQYIIILSISIPNYEIPIPVVWSKGRTNPHSHTTNVPYMQERIDMVLHNPKVQLYIALPFQSRKSFTKGILSNRKLNFNITYIIIFFRLRKSTRNVFQNKSIVFSKYTMIELVRYLCTLGFLTVSSTLKTRQAASVAAFIALICKLFTYLNTILIIKLESEYKTMQINVGNLHNCRFPDKVGKRISNATSGYVHSKWCPLTFNKQEMIRFLSSDISKELCKIYYSKCIIRYIGKYAPKRGHTFKFQRINKLGKLFHLHA